MMIIATLYGLILCLGLYQDKHNRRPTETNCHRHAAPPKH